MEDLWNPGWHTYKVGAYERYTWSEITNNSLKMALQMGLPGVISS